MSLEEIVKKYEEAVKTAAINPDEPQYVRSKAGIETAVAQAKLDVETLRKDYQQAVLDSGVAIFLKGPREKQAEFGKLVSDLQEAPVVDAEKFYRSLTDQVESTIGHTREFGPTQAARLHAALIAEAANVDRKRLRPLVVSEYPYLPNYEATLNLIRTTVRSQLGDSLNTEVISKSLADSALGMGFSGKSVPIIVLNTVPDESVALGHIFGKGRVTIEVTKEDNIDKEYIANAFKTVKNQLKKTTKQATE